MSSEKRGPVPPPGEPPVTVGDEKMPSDAPLAPTTATLPPFSEAAGKRLPHYESIAEVRSLYGAQLQEMRALLKNGTCDDDVICYRFLRGKGFDVAVAASYLDKSLAFRKQYKCDEVRAKAAPLRQAQFPHFQKLTRCYPHTIHYHQDRRGQPVSIERLGHTRPGQLVKLLTLDELVEYHLYHMENKADLVSRLSYERGQVMRTCKVIDLEGLSLGHLHSEGIGYMRHLIRMSQDAYPEMAGNVFVVNVPWLFTKFWGIVKPWLEPATLEKIVILGSNYQEELRKYIAPEFLPEFLGGTCPDECVVEADPDDGMTEVEVPSREFREVTINVPAAPAMISWEFRTRSKDIGFKATFVPAAGAAAGAAADAPLVLADGRHDSHKKNVYGSQRVESAGVLTLRFDNSYSRFTGKDVLYRYEVTDLSAAEAQFATAQRVDAEQAELSRAEAE